MMFTMFTNPLLCQKQHGVTTSQTDQIKVNRHYIPVGIVEKKVFLVLRKTCVISRNYTSFSYSNCTIPYTLINTLSKTENYYIYTLTFMMYMTCIWCIFTCCDIEIENQCDDVLNMYASCRIQAASFTLAYF